MTEMFSTNTRGLALAIVAMAIPQTAQAQDRRPTMEVTCKADQKTVDGPAAWFTGKVTISGQFNVRHLRESEARSSNSSRCPHRLA